jgi:ABC-type uncharacterized transport system involved in gliding motility auxiliary subunit
MSRLGNVLLIIGLICLLVALAAQSVLAQWTNGIFIPLGLALICVIAALVKDRRFVKEIMLMRTTQHGMNLGALVLIVAVALVAVNFMAVRYSKKWDLTEEKLYSLSDQSMKVAKNLKSDVKFYFFYRQTDQSHGQAKAQVKEMVGRYGDQSSHISIEFVDQVKRPDLAEAYDVTKSVEPVLIATVGAQKIRVDALTEQGVTNALIKVTRESKKKIYSLIGHGERDIELADPSGLKDFKKALEESSYELQALNLIEKQGVPSDADLVLMIGPEKSILEGELALLEKYLAQGGNLFLAIDPESSSPALIAFLKKLGIDYEPNFVLDQASQLLGASSALALGLKYSTSSEITKDFNGPNSMTLFNLATALNISSVPPEGVNAEKIVMTGPTSVTTSQLTRGEKVEVTSSGPHNIVLSSSGRWKMNTESNDSEKTAGTSEAAEFNVVVAGDSDFLSNQWLFQYFNRDLALNSVAFLAKDEDLISIRPKVGKTSNLELPRGRAIVYGILFLAFPLLLFIVAGVFWYRRRGA